MRIDVPRALLGALLLALLTPAPAQAVNSSLSSAPASRITVDIPGFGVYALHPDLVGRGLSPAPQADLLAAAVFSADYEDNAAARDAALAALDPGRHARVSGALVALRSPVATPDTLPPTAPIIVLGERLHDDGSMRDNLLHRLRAARELAAARPLATVVVTGGPTGPGGTESHAMRDWLLANGLTNPLVVEEESRSTVDSACLTHRLLPAAEAVIVVTSENHLPRAVVDFTLAFGPQVAGVGSPNDPPTAMPGKLWTYRDAVQWFLAPGTCLRAA
ncbi:MAG: DUF218 domain-containing protein [Corynebacterium humireducens]|jgi:hypothetical protein|uniref:DUF218 domain-containing protein n=1 Tax=Corynebacterium humireducens TaxID=1223514 RepID=A0A7X6SUG0_9CORY|nr:DUF218 domain-containing protein [Corynebacterium humireducens]